MRLVKLENSALHFLGVILMATAVVLIGLMGFVAAQSGTRVSPQINQGTQRQGWDISNSAQAKSKSERVVKTDAQWRAELDDLSYRVTRQKGTEPAYSGKYWDSKKDGIYTCKCCGQKLFDSKTKFKSGTGWPSYFQPIAPSVVTNVADRTLGMIRVEVVCSRCDAHLGHVFNDGPRPTGLRYCMNSCSLNFVDRKQATEVKIPGQASSAQQENPSKNNSSVRPGESGQGR